MATDPFADPVVPVHPEGSDPFADPSPAEEYEAPKKTTDPLVDPVPEEEAVPPVGFPTPVHDDDKGKKS